MHREPASEALSTSTTESFFIAQVSPLRPDQLFIGSLAALAVLSLLLTVMTVFYQAARSKARTRQIQALERLWRMNPNRVD
ncbi:hypothetical protein IFO70_13605 [Phormidium tenue FACHB-886]|nr:hypothetical protein [Phormidium tenue FACHB-886]